MAVAQQFNKIERLSNFAGCTNLQLWINSLKHTDNISMHSRDMSLSSRGLFVS
jgi:hypothetical protein